MKPRKCLFVVGVALCAVAVFAQDSPSTTSAPAAGANDAAVASIRGNASQLESAFNAGKVDEIAAMFLPSGELIDEEGTIHQGEKEIKALFTAFFTKFAGAKLTLDVESIRIVGPIAIEEGTRTIKTKDGATQAQFRYIAVRAKADGVWKFASVREVSDDPTPAPNERLQALAWLVGDWQNEGADGKVAISYQWSEDKNYLLGEFQMNTAATGARKSTQRIGWDANANKIRSWLFDADGGFAEGTWTILDDAIVIKSSSINPDGTTASATITVTQKSKDQFTFAGSERIVGDSRADDFELTVVRRPPAAGK